MAAGVCVPLVDVLGDIDNLRLDDRGHGSTGNGSGSDDVRILGGGRSRCLISRAAAWLRGAALNFSRGDRYSREVIFVIRTGSFASAEVQLKVGIDVAELGLTVIPVDVRDLCGLLGVVDVEDGAVFVVDCRHKFAVLVPRSQVEAIGTARAVFQVANAVDK